MNMTKRVLAYLLIANLGCGALACGDDDDAASAGSGGASGKSSTSGKGGASGGSGTTGSTAGQSGGDLTADDALAGVCDMMGMTGSGAAGAGASMCTGIDEYVACVQDQCGAADCIDDPACKAYVDCVQGADDPCTTSCAPSGDCINCYADVSTCAFDKCFDNIQCGERTDGGACDMLDDCCASLDDQMKMACDLVAGPTKAGGDMACQQLIDAFCP